MPEIPISTVLFQIINITADLVIFVFVGYYLLELWAKEKEIEKKEGKIDSEYHQVVDDALAKERKILEDATTGYHQTLDSALARERKIMEDASYQASQIISGAQYVNQASKSTIDQALQKMVVDVQAQATDASRSFMMSYQNSLKQIATQSLGDFQNIAKEMEVDLQRQIKEFNETLRPNLEKELEEYKQVRIKQTEQTITHIVQKVSQELLNKTLSLEDHQKLMIDSLDKAKKEGVFG